MTLRLLDIASRIAGVVCLIAGLHLHAQAQPAIRTTIDCGHIPGSVAPKLTAIIDTSDYVREMRIQGGGDPQYGSFVGLLVRERVVTEIYPLLPVLFFEEGSAAIPVRYNRFARREERSRFDANRLPGGTIEKYHQILNTIGDRLRRYPETRITLRGHDSQQPAIGETRELARERALAVARYLTDIWEIEPGRITVDGAGGFPRHRSNPRDSVANSENRRVEITSDDWRIVAPLVQSDSSRTVDPEQMEFLGENGLPAELVARREIQISQEGKPWHLITDTEAFDSPVVWSAWGKGGNFDSIPTEAKSFSATMVLYLKDGSICRSAPVEIPVAITNKQPRRVYCIGGPRDVYTLLLFHSNETGIDDIGMRIIRDFILEKQPQGCVVTVTGFASTERDPLGKSTARASAVARALRKILKPGTVASLTAAGASDMAPLYTDLLPEGRFLNRTVSVRIAWPTDD